MRMVRALAGALTHVAAAMVAAATGTTALRSARHATAVGILSSTILVTSARRHE